MILDLLSHGDRYASLHPAFARAFEFLTQSALASMAPGRHVIDGDRLYVSVDQKEGRGHEGARLESHRKYIDIQVTIEGDEEIGWVPTSECKAPVGLFDEGKDILFYEDRPDTWLSVPPERFAIFFPDDAHAPLAGRGILKKAIVKIAAEY
ncbi:MAG: YhcH/YjgK/YiaL family protein [Burkholderiales bacterium]